MEALEHAESIQQRPRLAYANYLSPLAAEDFPDHRQEDFEAPEEVCTYIPAEFTEEGTTEATFEHMTAAEAEKWATLIIDLFNDLGTGGSEKEEQ